MNEIVIKILQGSVVTQTVLGGLFICSPVTTNKFPIYTVCARNYENWLRVDKVNAIEMGAVFWHSV